MRNKKNPVVLGLTVTVTVLLSDTADCHCSVSVVFYLLLWMFVDIKQQVCISLRTTKRHRNVIAWCVALSVVLMQLSDRALAVTVLYPEIQSFFFSFFCVSYLIITWKEHLIARCFYDRTESFPSRGPASFSQQFPQCATVEFQIWAQSLHVFCEHLLQSPFHGVVMLVINQRLYCWL